MSVMLALVSLFLVACPSKPAPPKADIGEVTVTLLDRFGKPVPDKNVDHRREFTGSFSAQPYVEVDSKNTDASGKVVFGEAKDEDWVAASSPDERFGGEVTLAEGKTEYELHLTSMRYMSTSFGRMPIADIDKYEGDVERVWDSLRKMTAHYVKTKATDFSSLQHYIDEGVITGGEANVFLKLAPMMKDAEVALNFCWAGKNLRVKDKETPIQWVPEKD